MADVYLGLGTNLGQRRLNLQRAVAGLERVMTVTAVSPLYETEAWGVTDQPDFLNLCVAGITALSPHDLLHFAKELETNIGRLPSRRWGPRLIDIDILFYDQQVLQDEGLTIPHAALAERAFVLAPLADIAPGLLHPRLGKTVAELLTAVDQTSVRRLPEPLFPESQGSENGGKG